MYESETIEWIVEGLNNNGFKNYLGPLSRYSKPAQLLPDLVSGVHLTTNESKRSDGQKSDVNKNYRRQNDRKENGRTDPNTGPKQRLCFNCRGKGHSANQCTKPRSNKCFTCDKTGHMARECPMNSGNDNKTESEYSSSDNKKVFHIQSGQSKRLKYYKDAYVVGRKVRGYVDMGSESVTMREDAVINAGLKYEETCDRLVGYGQGEVNTLGKLTAELTVDGVTKTVGIHVVPNEAQQIALIIGQPFLDEVNVQSTPLELIITEATSGIHTLSTERVSKTPIWASEEIVIPNNYVGVVSVKTSIPEQDLCMEGGLREDGRILPRCLVRTDEEGSSLVPILNVTGGQMVVKEGTVLSRAEIAVGAESNEKVEKNKQIITREELKTELTGDQAKEILQLLNNYDGLIARNLKQVGCTDRAQIKIDLMSDTPVYYAPYRVSYHERG